MDLKLQLSDLRSNDETDFTTQQIKMKDSEIDTVTQPPQKLLPVLDSPPCDTNTTQTFNVEYNNTPQESAVDDPPQSPFESDLIENFVSEGAEVLMNADLSPDEQSMIDVSEIDTVAPPPQNQLCDSPACDTTPTETLNVASKESAVEDPSQSPADSEKVASKGADVSTNVDLSPDEQIMIEGSEIDTVTQPPQELLFDSPVSDTNTAETFNAVLHESAVEDPLQRPADSDLVEKVTSEGAEVFTNADLSPDEQSMVDLKPDPPLINGDNYLNASNCSIDIVADNSMEIISTENIITTSTDDKAAPDPPEFSKVVFDADSSIVRLHHDIEGNDEAKEMIVIKKEVDPPEFSNVVFDADASIVRLHYEDGEEKSESKVLEKREPDPPECTNVVYSYNSSSAKIDKEEVTELPMVEVNEDDASLASPDVEPGEQSIPPELSDTATPIEGEAEVDKTLLVESKTLEIPAIDDVLTNTTIDRKEFAVASDPAVILPIAEVHIVEEALISSDVKHSLETVETQGRMEKIDSVTSAPSEQNIPSLYIEAEHTLGKPAAVAEPALSSESFVHPVTELKEEDNGVKFSSDQNISTIIGRVAPFCEGQSRDTKGPSNDGEHFNSTGTTDLIVSECPSSQVLQSSFAEMSIYDDDCSYEEIIVDDDDEFIEYVDEILEDDFTEVTCDSDTGLDSSFTFSNNAGFNGNTSRSSNMDEPGYKRPVIKSATQKALEKEVAVKTAEAEEVMENVRFRLARQNSFCRKDDEYRKQLEMEEEEHLRQEEEEERKRAAELEKQSRLNAEKAKACIAQQQEAEMRQSLYNEEIRRQEMEAEAHRAAADQAAREKAATEKLRRDVEEREKTERATKRKIMEEEVRLLQAKLAEAKIAAELAKKKQMEEKMRLKAKVEAHRREKRRTSISEAVPTIPETAVASSAEPITKLDAVETVSESTSPPSTTPISSNTVYYSVDVLRQQSVPGLDYKNREIYIHPDEFQKLFQMSIAEFNEQPKWKRTNLKRKLKLF